MGKFGSRSALGVLVLLLGTIACGCIVNNARSKRSFLPPPSRSAQIQERSARQSDPMHAIGGGFSAIAGIGAVAASMPEPAHADQLNSPSDLLRFLAILGVCIGVPAFIYQNEKNDPNYNPDKSWY